MAFNICALKLPFFGSTGGVKAAEKKARDTVASGQQPSSWRGRIFSAPLPLIGHLPVGRQLQILSVLLILLLAVDGVVVALDARQGTFGTIYIATVGKIRMLSQRLAKAAQQASQGNLEAFKQLRESRDEFAAQMKLLLSGGAGRRRRPAPDFGSTRGPVLDALDVRMEKERAQRGLVIAEERNLIAWASAVRMINDNNPRCRSSPTRSPRSACRSGGSARQNAIAAQLMMLTQRMAKNANTMLAEAHGRPGGLLPARQGHQHLPRPAAGPAPGQRRAAHPAGRRSGAARQARRDWKPRSRNTSARWATSSATMQRLVNAKRASFDLFNDSETLLQRRGTA